MRQPDSRLWRCTCGSGLAREDGVSVDIIGADRPPSRASPLPQGYSVLLDQRTPQRMRLRGIDVHVRELADQGRIVAAEVDDTVILGPALQLARVFFRVIGHQDP